MQTIDVFLLPGLCKKTIISLSLGFCFLFFLFLFLEINICFLPVMLEHISFECTEAEQINIHQAMFGAIRYHYRCNNAHFHR